MIAAVYRILYGQDFIAESIASVLPFVDEVHVFWSDRPWGGKEVEDKVSWTKGVPFDGWMDRVPAGVKTHYHHQERPDNHYTNIVNKIRPLPELAICLEPDHVWARDQMERALRMFRQQEVGRAATSRQIELWRRFHWRVPERPHRTGTVFWNLEGLDRMPDTKRQAQPFSADFNRLDACVHNLGFCVSEKTMRRKHECAMAFSPVIKDSMPGQRWVDDKWLAWTPKNQIENLEISEGREYMIPRAIPYDPSGLPEALHAVPDGA